MPTPAPDPNRIVRTLERIEPGRVRVFRVRMLPEAANLGLYRDAPWADEDGPRPPGFEPNRLRPRLRRVDAPPDRTKAEQWAAVRKGIAVQCGEIRLDTGGR